MLSRRCAGRRSHVSAPCSHVETQNVRTVGPGHREQGHDHQDNPAEPEEEGQVKEKVVGASEEDVIFNFWVSLS